MTTTTRKSLFLLLRIVIAFVLLAALLVGLYVFAYRAYPTVGTWTEEGNHRSFVYEGTVYRLVSKRGGTGYSEKNYPFGEQLGRVASDGHVAGDEHQETEPATLPPDATPGETAKVTPPDGTPSMERDHAYVLYTVKDKAHILMLLGTDGKYYIYYPEIATWQTPGEHEAFAYNGQDYRLLGTIGVTDGLTSKLYAEGDELGLIRNDNHLALPSETETPPVDETESGTETIPGVWPPETTEVDPLTHQYRVMAVKEYRNLLLVEMPDGETNLYIREGSKDPRS